MHRVNLIGAVSGEVHELVRAERLAAEEPSDAEWAAELTVRTCLRLRLRVAVHRQSSTSRYGLASRQCTRRSCDSQRRRSRLPQVSGVSAVNTFGTCSAVNIDWKYRRCTFMIFLRSFAEGMLCSPCSATQMLGIP